jgi:hypothetical protein
MSGFVVAGRAIGEEVLEGVGEYSSSPLDELFLCLALVSVVDSVGGVERAEEDFEEALGTVDEGDVCDDIRLGEVTNDGLESGEEGEFVFVVFAGGGGVGHFTVLAF